MVTSLSFRRCRWSRWTVTLGTAVVGVLLLGTAGRADQTVRNTQNPNDVAPTPQETVRRMTVPEGFEVTLFAAEPDVRQPIAFDIDDRGRLWVAECLTYEGGLYDHQYNDRLLICDDVAGDGRFDRRQVFWEGRGPLTGVTLGFGGVWVLCAGELRLIPDRDRNDVPDGPAQVLLDGWEIRRSRHNIVNGLRWGPDGWLYGRHGITFPSYVGPPDTPDEKRTIVHCAIWRFHPTRHDFEVVCTGSTNPWGFDYDDHGQMFFTNNVNGHLWHVVPGAHFIRMHGEDPNPYVYELMHKCADHDHWDSSAGNWTVSRDGTGKHGELGGGHSHCGGMIYLGDNWPDRYRNTIFMCNTHGHRVNHDRIVREGTAYVGRHLPDFLLTGSPWFRGVELKYGPDGGVYLTDWTDLGECHDHDGVHRTSGRIYKITYGKPATAGRPVDVASLSNDELVGLLEHRNDWFVRHARRVLQERAASGADLSAVRTRLRRKVLSDADITRRLRALWALASIEELEPAWLLDLLDDESEHMRVWAIRLLADRAEVPAEAVPRLVELAERERSGLVRFFLASAAQRFPLESRWPMLAALDRYVADADDRNLTLMFWYAVEPAVPVHPDKAVAFVTTARRGLLRRLIARRLTERIDDDPAAVERLVAVLRSRPDVRLQRDVLTGMAQALRGRQKVRSPKNWTDIDAALRKDDEEIARLATELSAVFGDGRTLDALRQIAADPQQPAESRRRALQVLLANDQGDLLPLLRQLAGDRATRALAFRGLAAYDDPPTVRRALGGFVWMEADERSALLETACSRISYARELLRALEQKKVPTEEVSAFHVRRLQALGDPQIDKQLERVWGTLKETPAEKKQAIARYKSLLTPERLASADRSRGRALFAKTCAKCHRLFGSGAQIAPDLTGANRKNLDYLLENMVDPAALIPETYKVFVVVLDDGRVLTGSIVRQTDRIVELQTEKERLTLDRGRIDAIKPSSQSLMPEGQLKRLTDDQVADLIAYLMGDTQAPLPPTEAASAGSKTGTDAADSLRGR